MCVCWKKEGMLVTGMVVRGPGIWVEDREVGREARGEERNENNEG